jgi:AcrR family transcriptional regulator
VPNQLSPSRKHTRNRSSIEAAKTPPRRTLSPRRMRRAAEILDAARGVFLEKGFARSSVSEIATQVGVVEGLVYTYFPSKRDLLNAVLRGMYEPLIADLEKTFSRLKGVQSRMRFLIWRHLRVYVEDPGLSRLVLHEVRTGPEYFQSVLHELHVRYTAFLTRTIQEGVQQGELRADSDVELVRSMVYGGIEHLMWGTLFGRGSIDVEAMADRYTHMVLSSMLNSRDAPPPWQTDIAPTRMQGMLHEINERIERMEATLSGMAEAKSTVKQLTPSSKGLRRKAGT